MAKQAASAAERIISTLHAGERQDLLILAIPSHDKSGKELKDQDQWATAALDLFAELYGGATAFNTFAGIYKDNAGTIHRDKPIMIESYVLKADLEDQGRLEKLCAFIVRMGREARQKAVAVIINNVFIEITDFSAPKGKGGG
jgi:hypothetical protein